MSLPVPEHFWRAFEKNWNHKVQQTHKRIAQYATVKNFEGKELVMTDIDGVTWRESGRLDRSNPQEVTGDKRKLVKRAFDAQRIFDRNDKEFLGSLGRPDSELIQEFAYGWNRQADDLVIDAATAAAIGGPEPYNTLYNLPSSQKVAVNFGGGNTGLTAEKLIRARRIFEENDIFADEEGDELFAAVSPYDLESITLSIKSSTNDVWAAMLARFEAGESKKLFGITIKTTNRLQVDANTDIGTIPVWSRRWGIVVAPEKMEMKIDVLPEQKHAIQISGYANYGATRRSEKGVVAIYSDRSPT